MNELTLLRDFGPDATELSNDTFSAARAHLMTEIAETAAPARPVPSIATFRAQRRHRTGLRVRLGIIAAAACVAAAVIIAQPTTNPTGSTAQSAVQVVAYHTPQFPLAISPLPRDLAPAVFSGGTVNNKLDLLAVYADSTKPSAGVEASDVYLVVSPNKPAAQVPSSTMQKTVVDSTPAELWSEDQPASADQPTLHKKSLIWKKRPDQWVMLVGNGRYSNASTLRNLATSVVARPQPISLQMRFAPAGWSMENFKDNTILTLRDDTNSALELTVQVVSKPDPNFAKAVGGQSVDNVEVHGRPAQLVRTADQWVLQAQFSDGSAFTLQTPAILTEGQVVQLASGVERS